MTATARRFDFQDARRLAPPTARRLERWQAETCQLLTEAWSGISAQPLRATASAILPLRTEAAAERLPEPGLGIVLQLGQEKLPSLLAFDSQLLMAMLADLLGADAPDTTDVRSLTPLQEALIELLLGKVRESLADAWPGLSPLPCAIKETVRPRRSRMLSQWEEVIAIQWKIESRFHTGESLWLAPRRELEDLLSGLGPMSATGDIEMEQGLTALAEQLPLDVTVELGSASVNAQVLAGLKPGDVLLLDQAIYRPLMARVGGEPVWQVAPCRVGQRQAIEIRTLLQH
jgi:flagellar motor switch protein FliM